MARFDNTYSKFVAFAKIALPLASIAVLATLFLFARDHEIGLSIPYADVDIETLAHEQRVERPSFATVTRDGAELELSAELVRPDLSAKNVVNSSTIHGDLRLPQSGSVSLKADDGVIDSASQIAELSGHVEIETSTGYKITSQRIATLLDVSKIESPGTVDATGPAGDLTAGSMIISQDPETAAYLLVFKGGVKLVYQP